MKYYTPDNVIIYIEQHSGTGAFMASILNWLNTIIVNPPFEKTEKDNDDDAQIRPYGRP